MCFAETEGFEPSEPFTARLVSSEVLSTTQPRLLRFTSGVASCLPAPLRMNRDPVSIHSHVSVWNNLARITPSLKHPTA